MEPPQSREVIAITLLERYLKISTRIGIRSSIVVGVGLLLYIGIGVIGILLGVEPMYPFLSLEADPYFIIGSTAIGFFIVQGSGSLLLLHFLVGFEDDKSRFAVLMGFISLGFGGAILRIMSPAAARLILG